MNALALDHLDSFDYQTWITLDNRLSTKEIDLIKGCLKGNAVAQEKLYKHFYGYVMSIALRYSSNQEEAKEILNEGFLKIFTKLQLYDKSKSFKGWVRKIVINTSIDYFRSNQKHLNQCELTAAADFELDFNIIDRLSVNELLGLLHQLPESYRLVFNLFEIEGYSHKEISDILKIPIGTSRSNLTRAKQKLREMVIKLYNNELERSIR